MSIQGVFAGMILICVGLLLATRSAWDFSPTGIHVQNLSGFTTLGFVTWVMLANFEPSQTYGTNRQTIYLIVPFIVGLVVIFCMAITYQLYLMLVGGLGALAFGLWILGWKDNLSITSEYGRAILLTVLVVVFMIMSLVHHRFHILGAALAGSYLFFMGLDIFFHTGFLYCITTALDKNPAHGKVKSIILQSSATRPKKKFHSSSLCGNKGCVYHAIMFNRMFYRCLCHSKH